MLRPPPVMLRAVAASRKRPQNSLSPEWLDSATDARNDGVEAPPPCNAPLAMPPPVMLPPVMLRAPPVMLRAVAASRKWPRNGLSPERLDSATGARNDGIEAPPSGSR